MEPVASSVKAIPAPTPPADIVDDLCTKAAREVEALRIKDKAATEYIATIEQQAVVLKDIVSSQKDYIAQQKSIITDYKTMKDNDAKIHENDEKEKANLRKEIEILKAKKCGLVCQGLRILTGIGIGAIFF